MNLLHEGDTIVRLFASLLIALSMLSSCAVTFTHVHPYFGPYFGGGNG